MDDLAKTLGALTCIIPLAGIVCSVLIIIAYIKTYNRIKDISEKTSSILSEISKQQPSSAQYQTWYLDHCFMSNLGPHEWFANGKQDEKTYQFQCRKCGYLVNVPKVFSVRDGDSGSLPAGDKNIITR